MSEVREATSREAGERFRVCVTVVGDERDVEDRVVLALQAAGVEVDPESAWADRVEAAV